MAQQDAKSQLVADQNWKRYLHGLTRGHDQYQKQAKLCEQFYLGGGRHWSPEDKAALDEAGRPYLEENVIFSTVNTVIGYQTQSRMDIAYKPREIDDQDVSDVLSKLSMFIIDQNKYPWKESEVFADGLIEQRGYFDIKMDFDNNTYGDISISTLDPLDVIPDPDAKSYDPDDWSDVIVTSWMSHDDIKEVYGLSKWRQVENHMDDEADFGMTDAEQQRNKFGQYDSYSPHTIDDSGIPHAKLISRQYYKLSNREFYFKADTGDLYPVPDDLKAREKKLYAKQNGFEIVKKTVKRIRWTVSTRDVVLHDEWSPYKHFTVVPYFPYFRRGVTIGLIDNLIKTQEMINKTYSQILHVINTTANSGWVVEENSLTNMDVEDLEDVGAQSGLVLEYKRGQTPPAKIEPNQIPTGLKDLVHSGLDLMKLISGVSETFQGGKGPEVSGTAIQSRVHQSAIQLAAPIDNLFRTRNMIAVRVLELIQDFYTQERTFMITGSNPDTGQESSQPVSINQETPDKSGLINDVTVGKYDVVIADVPTQITFQNSQFAQAIELRKFGVQIPDDEMVKMSSLARKNEIAKRMANSPTPEQQAIEQRQLELQMKDQEMEIISKEAQSNKLEADTLKQVADVAGLLAANPALGKMLSVLLQDIQTTPQPLQLQGSNQQLGKF